MSLIHHNPITDRFLYPHIYYIYIMKRVPVEFRSRLVIEGMEGYIGKTVTRFGTGAKVDCPKEYIGRKVYLVILKHESE